MLQHYKLINIQEVLLHTPSRRNTNYKNSFLLRALEGWEAGVINIKDGAGNDPGQDKRNVK